MLPDPRPYVNRPFFLRKKVILIFAGVVVLFLILGAVASYQLYNEMLERGQVMNWEHVLKPLWYAPLCGVGIYACVVGFWLVFRLKSYQKATIDHMLQNGVIKRRKED